jgi:hypothetical protein
LRRERRGWRRWHEPRASDPWRDHLAAAYAGLFCSRRTSRQTNATGGSLRITRTDGQISIRDRPAPSWALGGFLLIGGLVAVAMPLGLATNADDLELWERLASLGIGVGVRIGAVWWLARNPKTHVQLDLTRRHMRLVRVGLSGRHVRRLSFDDLDGAEVEQGSDSEGGPIWWPAVRLRDGQRVLLSELWSHDRVGVAEGVAAVAAACGLPTRHLGRDRAARMNIYLFITAGVLTFLVRRVEAEGGGRVATPAPRPA